MLSLWVPPGMGRLPPLLIEFMMIPLTMKGEAGALWI
jgi:hypothetical protein